MERVFISQVKEGKKVLLKGWVHNTRDLGNLVFVMLRDVSGMIQVTAHKDKVDKKVFELLSSISKESCILVEGKSVKNKQAPSGVEVIPEKVSVLAKSEEILPIDVQEKTKTELPKRLDYRFLDLHRPRVQAIFKVQSQIINSFRKFFFQKGFFEIQPPNIISSASEGGTELFKVQYFEKQAFLAQSPQLYKQMLVQSLEKVFMTVPVWRAEKHNTTRHLNESRQMDIEVAFASQQEIIDLCTGVVQFIVKEVLQNCKQELKLLNVNLKVPKVKKLSYTEAIKLVGGKKGEDFSPEQEKLLCNKFPDTVIATQSWPAKLKPFYIMPQNENVNSELSEGFDALYGGMEISSGGQRVHIPQLLEAMLKKKGLKPEYFKYYIDSFRFGSPMHAGWSIGLERLTAVMLKLDNIREACLFPRDRERLVP